MILLLFNDTINDMNILPTNSLKTIRPDLQGGASPQSILGSRTFSQRTVDSLLSNFDSSEIEDLTYLILSEDENSPPSKSRKTNSQYWKKLQKPAPRVYRAICTKNVKLLATGIDELVNNSNYLEVALHSAIKKNWKSGTALLLKKGADPNWRDPETGSSAINCSKFATHKEMFFLLLKWNASLFLPLNRQKQSALHLAAASNSHEVVKKIIEKAPLSLFERDIYGKLPVDYVSKKQR
ncbi:MAG: ankyrin repeat domain-containing protein [Candidatus Algichlamydia australiensis]|nr:ankyrin repeat domain-containing protein [Chlamydiales bacterium]